MEKCANANPFSITQKRCEFSIGVRCDGSR